jgi:DNA-binding CsgD family transcriptional regulator
MQVYDFTNPELDMLRQQCNFSDEELEYFNLRAKHLSNVQISLQMHISESKVSKLARKVKSKILRTL